MHTTIQNALSEPALGRNGSRTNVINMGPVEILLNAQRSSEAVELLRGLLHSAKSDSIAWAESSLELQGNSFLRDTLNKCPYIQRAKVKPRGYAGDGVMMDYVYGIFSPELLRGMDALGEEIFRSTTNSTAAGAVRYRRRLISQAIDAVCQTNGQNILSLACGHLREAELSLALKTRRFGEFFALDHDPESVQVVADCYGQFDIRPVHSSVARLLADKFPPEMSANLPLHFIYSAGLYDYLDESTALGLTKKLGAMLAPQGRILLANFLPGHKDVGFMEAVMDWHLVYRTPVELESLVVRAGLTVENTHVDPFGSIVYVTGRR